MMNSQFYYYKFSDYLKERFGEKVWKIPVDAGFTCPNRDGLKGEGGCIYCSVDSFNGAEQGDIKIQIERRINKLKERNINKYIIYFQSYSNTYADVEVIRERIEGSLIDEGIVGIHIGTRPDVIDSRKLEYLSELSERYEVVIEYGLQSANDATLNGINRGHSVVEFVDAVKLTHEYGIKTCAHIIFGLPGDSREDMLDSIWLINSLDIHSVKFHHLHVVKGTKLAEMYIAGGIKLLTEDEYISVLAEAMSILNRKVVIGRIIGDASGDTLIAPDWPKTKSGFEQKLSMYMKSKGLTQGLVI